MRFALAPFSSLLFQAVGQHELHDAVAYPVHERFITLLKPADQTVRLVFHLTRSDSRMVQQFGEAGLHDAAVLRIQAYSVKKRCDLILKAGIAGVLFLGKNNHGTEIPLVDESGQPSHGSGDPAPVAQPKRNGFGFEDGGRGKPPSDNFFGQGRRGYPVLLQGSQ